MTLITTQVLTIDAIAPDPALIQLAAQHLRAGKLVAFPTETVYGLGANALEAAAVQRIFTAKGRPASDPLIVHLHDQSQLPQVAQSVPALAHKLAEAFWPGPLTLVVPRHPRVPPEVAAGRDTIAVRVPRHPVALALLRAADLPIAAPSANRFAQPSPTTAQHVLDDLNGRIELVLDAGPVPIGLESTIVDVTQDPPVILRPGGLPMEALLAHIPHLTLRQRYLPTDEPAAAPGMFLKHYAPRAELRLFDGPRAAVLAEMHRHARALREAQRSIGVLAVDEDVGAFEDLDVTTRSLGSSMAPETVGQRLFAGLRELDQRGVAVILARLPGREGLGLAIWDRLYRAAEGRVIEVMS